MLEIVKISFAVDGCLYEAVKKFCIASNFPFNANFLTGGKTGFYKFEVSDITRLEAGMLLVACAAISYAPIFFNCECTGYIKREDYVRNEKIQTNLQEQK